MSLGRTVKVVILPFLSLCLIVTSSGSSGSPFISKVLSSSVWVFGFSIGLPLLVVSGAFSNGRLFSVVIFELVLVAAAASAPVRGTSMVVLTADELAFANGNTGGTDLSV